jgi:hypothetical protein
MSPTIVATAPDKQSSNRTLRLRKSSRCAELMANTVKPQTCGNPNKSMQTNAFFCPKSWRISFHRLSIMDIADKKSPGDPGLF